MMGRWGRGLAQLTWYFAAVMLFVSLFRDWTGVVGTIFFLLVLINATIELGFDDVQRAIGKRQQAPAVTHVTLDEPAIARAARDAEAQRRRRT